MNHNNLAEVDGPGSALTSLSSLLRSGNSISSISSESVSVAIGFSDRSSPETDIKIFKNYIVIFAKKRQRQNLLFLLKFEWASTFFISNQSFYQKR